ncbi:hypothetical protein ACEWY4_014377 [Coilia grayii]|uniref:Uncharacterized protein n=1 Tax=Coilia grayii TaxID=363190 RepID=A0ABD1JS54_9TELE
MFENIEMKLFSSLESSLHQWTKEDTELMLKQTKRVQAPLKCQKTEEAVVKQKEDAPATVHEEDEEENDVAILAQAIEIEMEVLHSCKDDVRGVKPEDFSVLSPDPEKTSLTPRQRKESRPKWRRMELKPTGLVVKDVICLPFDTYLKEDELYYVPDSVEREILTSVGLVARITIDSTWLSEEIEGRLSSLFKHRFYRSHAEKFQFKYLQCLQGSRVLFQPSLPKNSWTASEVLGICEKSALYILSLHNLVDKEVSCAFDLYTSNSQCGQYSHGKDELNQLFGKILTC